MKDREIVRQQRRSDKHYFTGENGQGFIIRCVETGRIDETAPTLEQAEERIALFKERGDGKTYEIISCGDEDAKGHAPDSPFRFTPVD